MTCASEHVLVHDFIDFDSLFASYKYASCALPAQGKHHCLRKASMHLCLRKAAERIEACVPGQGIYRYIHLKFFKKKKNKQTSEALTKTATSRNKLNIENQT